MAAPMANIPMCLTPRLWTSYMPRIKLILECGHSPVHTSSFCLLRRRRGGHTSTESSGTKTEDGTSIYFPSHAHGHGHAITSTDALQSPSPSPSGKQSYQNIKERQGINNVTVRADISVANDTNGSPLGTGSLPRYDKAGLGDKRLGRAMMLAKSRKYREQKDKVVLEGKRLIADALKAGARADTIFFSQVSNVEGLPLAGSKVNLVKVAFKDITLWSDMGSPQGIIGVFRRPSYDNLSLDDQPGDKIPLTLICDNIRDPGNLGTILRSAAAAACHQILLTKGCVDAWDPKVLRSAAGAHFRVPIISSLPWSSVGNYLSQEGSVHAADCNYDSLQRGGDGKDSSGRDERALKDFAQQDCGDERRDQVSDLRTVPYFGVNWALGDCALVIGGETEGLSVEAVDLCRRSGGSRVFIPMSMGVDSLNAAMATSVILFEAKRQLLLSRT